MSTIKDDANEVATYVCNQVGGNPLNKTVLLGCVYNLTLKLLKRAENRGYRKGYKNGQDSIKRLLP